MSGKRKVLVASLAALAGLAATLSLEILRARGVVRLEGFTRDQLDALVGSGDATPLRMTWIGDSLSVGVGASAPDHALGREVAARLGGRIAITTLGVSGATAADAVAVQLPLLAATKPDWVFVEIGSNDVSHLTSRRRFRAGLERLLSGIDAVHPKKVIVLGVAEFGSVALFGQPLRAIAGWRSHVLGAVVRSVAERHHATYVDIAGPTGPPIAREPDRLLARDRFHLSDAGYGLWADVVVAAIRSFSRAT